MDLPDPPEGWFLKALIINERDNPPVGEAQGIWMVHLRGDGEYVYGYGASAIYAILDAIKRIDEGDAFEDLSGMQPTRIDLVEALGITPKKQRIGGF